MKIHQSLHASLFETATRDPLGITGDSKDVRPLNAWNDSKTAVLRQLPRSPKLALGVAAVPKRKFRIAFANTVRNHLAHQESIRSLRNYHKSRLGRDPNHLATSPYHDRLRPCQRLLRPKCQTDTRNRDTDCSQKHHEHHRERQCRVCSPASPSHPWNLCSCTSTSTLRLGNMIQHTYLKLFGFLQENETS